MFVQMKSHILFQEDNNKDSQDLLGQYQPSLAQNILL